MNPLDIHTILTAEAFRVGLPQFYKRDLTYHDFNELTETGTQDFLYVLRTCGTFLVPLDSGKSQFSFVSAIGRYSDDEMLWYHFHDGILEPITRERAIALSH